MRQSARVVDMPKPSGAVQEIAEELRTPVNPTVRDYADVGAILELLQRLWVGC